MLKILIQKLAFPVRLLARGFTLGVRAVVLKGDDVLLVRHTYMDGWYLPGGGVDRGEALEKAAVRECFEEVGVHIQGEFKL
ncbi:MAG: NUDIX domain-containing protein, partial [Pseudomonadota bacterium]